ncbi:hypothetical protein D9M68_587780 [compost metagenome]
MASSTTIPMARTNANKVNRLMVKPKRLRKKNVPTMATGTLIAGMRVDLKSCKKINTTKNTRIKASIRVCSTFSIEASRKSFTLISVV